MPVSLERRLKKAAKKKFGSTTSKTARRYIWGGMIITQGAGASVLGITMF